MSARRRDFDASFAARIASLSPEARRYALAASVGQRIRDGVDRVAPLIFAAALVNAARDLEAVVRATLEHAAESGMPFAEIDADVQAALLPPGELGAELCLAWHLLTNGGRL